MSKWPMVRLGDVVTVNCGYAFKSTEFVKNDIPVIRIGNISDNKVNLDYDTCYSRDFWYKNSAYRVYYGDLLIAMSGATVGKVGQYLSNEPALLNQRVGVIRNNDNPVNLNYIYQYLKSTLFLTTIQQLSLGCAQPNISAKDIGKIKISLPPLEVQKKIAQKLDAAAELTALRKKQLAELDNLLKSVFYDMFGDPVNNERGFEIVSLDKVCDKITDGTHQTPIYCDSGYIFLSSKNVTSGKIDWKDIKYIPEELHTQLYKRLSPQVNDILLAKNGTTGIAALVDRDVEFDIYVSLALLRPKSGINPVFLLSSINSKSTKRQFDRKLKGIGVPNLHLNAIKEVLIPLPPLSLQNQFAAVVAKVEEQKDLVQKAIDESQYLFDSLMGEYFG